MSTTVFHYGLTPYELAHSKEFPLYLYEGRQLDVTKTNNYTAATWHTIWYEVYAEPRLRPNTKLYHQNYINNYIIPETCSIKLEMLTTIQIQRFYNALQKNGRIQRK